MSFEANDIIHLGNYEEFFILYMDNELSEEQVQMVDAFLLAHPDLQAEFEILMSTKLPVEDFSFDKTELMADKMKFSSVDEELLLYIDNELPSDKKNVVELELASNKDYKLQHQLLLQTKLSPSETISYPNKEELYRRTERRIAFLPWMRIAAAVVVIAVSGWFYFSNTSSPSTDINPGTVAKGQNNSIHTPVQQNQNSTNQNSGNEKPDVKNDPGNEMASTTPSSKKDEVKQEEIKKLEQAPQPMPNNVIALNNANDNNNTNNSIENNGANSNTAVTRFIGDISGNNDHADKTEPSVSVNNTLVTSSSLVRPTDNNTADGPDGPSQDRNGSVRGFLRKATRMIEKRTGIDPTDDGKLLIGSVAINLK